MGDLKICIVCGKEFRVMSGKQKTCCADCSETARKNYMAVYRNTHKKKYKAKPKEKPPRIESITEIQRKAQEMHLSYGQYLAQKRAQRELEKQSCEG